MKKQKRFHIGDTVRWPGGPNEFCDNRTGVILDIKDGMAIVDDWRKAGKTRQVPLNILY